MDEINCEIAHQDMRDFIFVILRLRLLKFGVKDSNVFQIILLHIVGVTRTVI